MHREYFLKATQETDNVGCWDTDIRSKLFIVHFFMPFEF